MERERGTEEEREGLNNKQFVIDTIYYTIQYNTTSFISNI